MPVDPRLLKKLAEQLARLKAGVLAGDQTAIREVGPTLQLSGLMLGISKAEREMQPVLDYRAKNPFPEPKPAITPRPIPPMEGSRPRLTQPVEPSWGLAPEIEDRFWGPNWETPSPVHPGKAALLEETFRRPIPTEGDFAGIPGMPVLPGLERPSQVTLTQPPLFPGLPEVTEILQNPSTRRVPLKPGLPAIRTVAGAPDNPTLPGFPKWGERPPEVVAPRSQVADVLFKPAEQRVSRVEPRNMVFEQARPGTPEWADYDRVGRFEELTRRADRETVIPPSMQNLPRSVLIELGYVVPESPDLAAMGFRGAEADSLARRLRVAALRTPKSGLMDQRVEYARRIQDARGRMQNTEPINEDVVKLAGGMEQAMASLRRQELHGLFRSLKEDPVSLEALQSRKGQGLQPRSEMDVLQKMEQRRLLGPSKYNPNVSVQEKSDVQTLKDRSRIYARPAEGGVPSEAPPDMFGGPGKRDVRMLSQELREGKITAEILQKSELPQIDGRPIQPGDTISVDGVPVRITAIEPIPSGAAQRIQLDEVAAASRTNPQLLRKLGRLGDQTDPFLVVRFESRGVGPELPREMVPLIQTGQEASQVLDVQAQKALRRTLADVPAQEARGFTEIPGSPRLLAVTAWKEVKGRNVPATKIAFDLVGVSKDGKFFLGVSEGGVRKIFHKDQIGKSLAYMDPEEAQLLRGLVEKPVQAAPVQPAPVAKAPVPQSALPEGATPVTGRVTLDGKPVVGEKLIGNQPYYLVKGEKGGFLAVKPENTKLLGAVGTAMLMGAAGEALVGREEDKKEPLTAPDGIQGLRETLNKTPVSMAGVGNIQGLLRALKAGKGAFEESLRSVPQELRQAGTVAAGMATDALTGLPGVGTGTAVLGAMGAMPQDVRQTVKSGAKELAELSKIRNADVVKAPGYDLYTKGVERNQPYFRLDPSIEPKVSLELGGSMMEVRGDFRRYGKALNRLDALGLRTALDQYLDMEGVKRAHSLVGEHIGDFTRLAIEQEARGERSAAAATRKLLAEAVEKRRTGKGITFGDMSVARADEVIKDLKTQAGPERWKEIQKVADILFESQTKVLKRQVGEGLLSTADFNKYVSRGKYVPLTRIMNEWDPVEQVLEAHTRRMIGDMTAAGRKISIRDNKLIDLLRGSSRATMNPVEAMMDRIETGRRQIAQNRVAKLFVQALKKGEAGKVDGVYAEEVKGAQRTLKPDEGTISYFVDGKPTTYIVPRSYADLANFATIEDYKVGSDTLQRFRGVLQTMATGANLGFLVRNVPRDISDAVMLSKMTSSKTGIPSPKILLAFGKTWAKSAFDLIIERESNLRSRFEKSGAGFSTFTESIAPEDYLRNPGAKNHGTTFSRAMSFLRKPINATENATKMAAFDILSRFTDLSPEDIAFEVRRFGGSPDFARKGLWARQAGQLIMFLNPQVQGIDRNIQRYSKEPGRLLGQMVALSAGALALYNYNRSYWNEQVGRPEIELVPEQERKTNFIVMLPETQELSNGQIRQLYVRIPKGHAIQLLMNPFEDGIKMANGEPGMTAGQAGANVLSQLLPGSGNIDAKNPLMSLAKGSVAMLNPALKIPLEQVGNINTYTGAPIVGRRIGELPPSEQSTQATSPVMKGLGKILGMIPGVGKTPLASPVRWEHAFRSMFPGPGEMVLAAADQALGPKVPPARGAIEELAKRPWSGPIVRSLIPSVHSQERLDLGEDFYAALQEAGAATTMINNLMKSGRTDEARTRLADPAVRKSLQMNRPLQALAEQLGQVNQWRNRVIQNEGMTPEAKRQEMQKIWMTELQILRRGAALVKQ